MESAMQAFEEKKYYRGDARDQDTAEFCLRSYQLQDQFRQQQKAEGGLPRNQTLMRMSS